MLTPDYQEFANRVRIVKRDNSVIYGLRMGELAEIAKALRDCHAVNRHESGTSACIGAQAGRLRPDLPVDLLLRSTRVPLHPLPYGVFVIEVSSGRLAITLSTIPKSRAISAVRNLSRSSASSIAL